jgi:voltage-gated potassium channel
VITPRPSSDERPLSPWRARLHEVIFESETAAGRTFDILLLIAIGLSVVAVTLESVQSIAEVYAPTLRIIEWFFTALFTVEYVLRLLCVRRPMRYALSFYGMVDLLAIVPTFLGLIIPGAQSLMAVRVLRLVRIFRIFKLAPYVGESRLLLTALKAARPKISVFLLFVATSVCTMGALMYVVEGPEHGFTNIPTAIYWAIVTLTTVGYGDIAPGTPLGKVIASGIMIMGYGVLAVPTGIVTTEIAFASRSANRPVSNQACPACGREGHDIDAGHCKYCGAKL